MSAGPDQLKLADLVKANRELAPQGAAYEIGVIANITLGAFPDVLEYVLRREKVPARVTLGEYNNILQDAQRFAGFRCVMIFWEPSNMVDGLYSQMAAWDEARIVGFQEAICAQMKTLFAALSRTSLVVINRFSSLLFDSESIRQTRFGAFCRALNGYLDAHAPGNFVVVDIDKVIARVGITQAFDERFFYSAKAPFSVALLREYAAHVMPIFLAANGLSSKVLLFDCDNTLWKGIVGEDGPEGIALSAQVPAGAPFSDVQALALGLQRDGVLIGLCSKNNPEEVDEILASHPEMGLREHHIAIKRVNWEDKVANIRDIARELNLGLDSFVFVDDSDFELESVRGYLPEVRTLRVPAQAHAYPRAFRTEMQRFFSLARGSEDAQRTALYKAEAGRTEAQKQFHSMDDYLASLDLSIEVRDGPSVPLERVAQLTQKTNQFNLTTIRYSAADLQSLLESDRGRVLSFGLSDRFGSYGVVGVAILRIADRRADLDSFLMSCRAMGRRVEFAFFDHLVDALAQQGYRELTARYIATRKNAPVATLLDTLGFERMPAANDTAGEYRLMLERYVPSTVTYVKVSYVS